ncbi:allantoate amidohydrolase [Kineococcus radiotolerans]|uniref:Amidase, hydantoinase/carbamoylase family n=1 Tax=Kineococcus radiotolerans (strain ATCC BAA-149 / DSM 14245 / SRS30216) TaxID=266940 RepID=A6WFK1_KINRD|nr:allantoate amidohydrolase [Kineococcus radiotolerans]ABS05590.1 amidase, hydantoinase/carbamoylase family [Kineococcus radiotolerans SRS30216 = ATCC BAA-149]
MAEPTTATGGLLAAIAGTGRDAVRGGYSRPVFSTAERDLVSWYEAELTARGLEPETDRNGIVWAWWNPAGLPLEGAVVTGSHLDSVPGGGAFDGPLGVASALRALDLLRGRGVEPARPLGLAVFPEEEGSRFGVACLGSRLLTGAVTAERALNLTDPDGNTFADVARRAGLDPAGFGRDEEALARIGVFVELHVEQGRGLVDLDAPVAVASSILGHGRWRFSVHGQGNHAGTTLLDDRRDPLLAASRVVVAVREVAAANPGTRATVGRLQPVPGGTNVIASRVDLWLDVRHPDDAVTAAVVAEISRWAVELAAGEGCTVDVREESLSPTVDFDPALARRLGATLGGVPALATGAGHDAGVLAAHVPTAMLFTRNPTGVSHSPEEFCTDDDAEAGSVALADVLADLLR